MLVGTTACQKEDVVSDSRLEIVAEGMADNGSKMTVNNLSASWSSGDQVWLNGTTKEIAIEGSTAYVENVDAADTYRGLFPASIYSSGTGTTVRATLPSVYTYEKESSLQKLASPMMAYRASGESGRLFFRHLTAALVVQVKNSTGARMVLDNVVVSCPSGQLCGDIDVDFTNIGNFTHNAAASDGSNKVSVVFDGSVSISSTTLNEQVPVLPVSGQSFTVRVVGHEANTNVKFVYNRTQDAEHTGSIARGKLGYVPVTFNSAAEADGYFVRPTRLRELGGKSDSLAVGSLNDLKLMFEIASGSSHSNNNYTLTADIDATGYQVSKPAELCGMVDGQNHKITGLTISGSSEVSLLAAGGHAKNIIFRNLTLSATSSGYVEVVRSISAA